MLIGRKGQLRQFVTRRAREFPQRKAQTEGGRKMRSRYVQVGLALGLIVSAPAALGQKMYKCSDGKGGTTFQQTKCPDTAEEAEAHAKEKARLESELQRKKEEEARKKEESIQKAKERDQAYQKQLEEKAEADRKAREAEAKLMQGTTKAKDVDDGTLPTVLNQSYPGAWKEVPSPEITAALAKNKTPACSQYRYRQRGGGLPEFIVQCTTDKANWVTYFVWPKSEAVKGPAKF